jgi:hypothetical protein
VKTPHFFSQHTIAINHTKNQEKHRFTMSEEPDIEVSSVSSCSDESSVDSTEVEKEVAAPAPATRGGGGDDDKKAKQKAKQAKRKEMNKAKREAKLAQRRAFIKRVLVQRKRGLRSGPSG